MQFLITAYDYTDEGALERRLSSREQHLSISESLLKKGKYLYAVAILDDKEKMIGSSIIADFCSREELDECFKNEPYILGKVWEKIDIKCCKVGAAFMKLHL